MVVHRDDRGVDLAGLRLGEEQLRVEHGAVLAAGASSRRLSGRLGIWPSSKRKRIDAVWLPVAMSCPPPSTPAASRGRTRRWRQLAEELDEHPLRVGHATVEAHAVVEARPGAHLPGRSGDRHRHHVGDEREHRRCEGPVVAALGPEGDGGAVVPQIRPGASRCAWSSCRRSGRRAWLVMRGGESSGALTFGIGTYWPVSPSSTAMPVDPMATNAVWSLALARTRSWAARLPTASRSTSHVDGVALERLAHELRGAPQHVALGGGLHRDDRHGQSRAAVERRRRGGRARRGARSDRRRRPRPR